MRQCKNISRCAIYRLIFALYTLIGGSCIHNTNNLCCHHAVVYTHMININQIPGTPMLRSWIHHWWCTNHLGWHTVQTSLKHRADKHEILFTFIKTYRYSLGLWLGDNARVLQVKVSDAACHGQPAVDVWLSQTIPGDKTPTSLYPRGRYGRREVQSFSSERKSEPLK